MRKFAVLLGILLLFFVVPHNSIAQIVSYPITSFSSGPEVLFDSSLGSLTSVHLEFKFQTSVIYEHLGSGPLGTMSPFDVTFSEEAPFHVGNLISSRDTMIPWTIQGHSEGGSGSYFSAQGTGTFSQTYTGQSVLDFFTLHDDDQGLIFHPSWSGWVTVSPEVVYDDLLTRYDAYFASAQLGDGIVITYDYEAITPIPEAETAVFLGIGMILLLSSQLGLRKRDDPA